MLLLQARGTPSLARHEGRACPRDEAHGEQNLQALEFLTLLPKGGKSLLDRGTHHLAGGGKCCGWPLKAVVRYGVDFSQAICLSLVPMIHECCEYTSFFAGWLAIQGG
jgi:hypothetical protein